VCHTSRQFAQRFHLRKRAIQHTAVIGESARMQ
jgi:hypothetical protein